jgi:hypothetical protein
MKDTVLYALNGILLVAVIVLFFLVLKPGGKKAATTVAPKSGVELKETGLIAYVDLDTLQENYILFKEKKAELEKKQTNIENTLQQRVAAFQKEVYDLQQRAAMMTQSEGEAARRSAVHRQRRPHLVQRCRRRSRHEQVGLRMAGRENMARFVAGLPVDPAFRPGVVANMALAMKMAAHVPVPNHRIASGIQAIGAIGRKVSMRGSSR